MPNANPNANAKCKYQMPNANPNANAKYQMPIPMPMPNTKCQMPSAMNLAPVVLYVVYRHHVWVVEQSPWLHVCVYVCHVVCCLRVYDTYNTIPVQVPTPRRVLWVLRRAESNRPVGLDAKRQAYGRRSRLPLDSCTHFPNAARDWQAHLRACVNEKMERKKERILAGQW